MTPTEERRHKRNTRRREVIDGMAKRCGYKPKHGRDASHADEFMDAWERGEIIVMLTDDDDWKETMQYHVNDIIGLG